MPARDLSDDLLRDFFKTVVDVATKSAEASTSTAKAIQTLSVNVASLQTELSGVKTELNGLKTENAALKSQLSELKRKLEHEDPYWKILLKALVSPQNLAIIVPLIAAYLGLQYVQPGQALTHVNPDVIEHQSLPNGVGHD